MSFLELEEKIQQKLHNQKEDLKEEKIEEIDPEILTKYNSINVFLGKAGSGKSFNILQTFAKISIASPNTHLIIYITKSGRVNDKTFDLFQEFIKIPIIFCSLEDAVSKFNEILQWKEIYRKIQEGDFNMKNLTSQNKKTLFEKLHIHNFKHKWLHTIVYFEDAHKNPLLYGNNKNLYFLQRIPLFRHDNCSYYFAIQLLVGFPTDLKTQITDLFLFPGYSNQQLKFIMNHVNIEMKPSEFIEYYKELDKREFIRINNETGDVEFY
ncbi:hypothetical protein TRFO_16557 [Tritrichomonas foetus]|uniref:Uncharacterized protein n=1 Tax=Tritrichomonas foetus TaxID=1144522 RepID=A0A1J4KQ29_9EUKA|nr:hypothetical protein TRFO_16557 [Tritrichomonas foetus]|eukprot:OHT13347.1 hypothetical protein TRFO_16557 [Tritrichomonas foetus]